LRNEEFEEAIRNAYKDVDTIPELEKEVELSQESHQERAERLLSLQKET